MAPHGAANAGFPAGDRGGQQQRCRLDTIVDHAVRCSAEPLAAVDLDRIGSQSVDPCAQRNQELAQVDNLGLLSGRLDHRTSAG